jgi:hypothetical protein
MTVIVVTASVKEDERGGQGYTQAYCISLPHDTTLWTRTVLTRVLFQLHVSFCLRWTAKLNNKPASSFVRSSVNPLPKALKFFVRLLENIL